MSVALTLAVGLGMVNVESFLDDTHYSFTYYIARVCGYTPMQAHRLASLDLAVDYSPSTEPVQRGGITAAAQAPRVDFHAFRDARAYLSDKEAEAANQAIRRQRDRLKTGADAGRNPGILLHFVQDETSHKDYWSFAGHYFNAVLRARDVLSAAGTARVGTNAVLPPIPITDAERKIAAAYVNNFISKDLPLGTMTDYLAYRTDRDRTMIGDTLEELRSFMTRMSPKQRLLCSADPRQSTIVKVLSGLIKANQKPQKFEETVSQAAWSIIFTQLGFEGFHNWTEEPVQGLANAVVQDALTKLRFELQPFPQSPIPYDVGSGRGLGDTSILYGDLRVRLQRGDSTRGDVKVSLWMPPTRRQEIPYMLDCKSSAYLNAAQNGDVEFDKVPVGDLIVQTVSPGGSISRQSIVLDRLKHEVSIAVPKETEESKKCGKKVEPPSRAACDGLAKPTVDASQIKRLESLEKQINADLASESSCRDADQTKKAEQKTGRSAGAKVASAVAAAGVGVGTALYLANEQKKRDETTTTTTIRPTTTTTTSTTTTTPSTTTTTISTASRFDGTYRVVATTTCTMGSDPLSPCARAFDRPGCPVTPFNFTVNNGIVNDPCNNIVSGSVNANGVFSGLYTSGSPTGNMVLTGTFTTTGTFTLSGSIVSLSNTYRSTLQVTKQ